MQLESQQSSPRRMRQLAFLIVAGIVALALLLRYLPLPYPFGTFFGAHGEVALPTWDLPDLPPTAAGRQMAAYLAAFNSGDADTLTDYVSAQFTPEGPGGSTLKDRIGSQMRFLNSSRGLNLYQVVDSGETVIAVVAQLRLTQEWRRITMTVEDAPPYRVTGVRLEPVDAPEIVATQPLTQAQFAQQLDAYMADLVAADRFSGVLLVAKEGVPVYEAAFGMSNQEAGLANSPETHFSVASVGKMFTAVAIAQLVEAGKLAYDEPIHTYLPDYPLEPAQQVTVDHLLTHRSGIVDFFADRDRFATVKESDDPQRDYPALFMHEPLRFTPGERFEYSNSNYIVLGRIIEELSGQHYADYLRTHIFEPAGMSSTYLSAQEIDPALLAHGYTELGDDGELTPGVRRPNTDELPAEASAAGGLYTTVGDLLKFSQALQDHRLLGEESTETLLAGRVDEGRPGYQYGYGFISRRAGAEEIVGHSGGFPGVDAQFEIYRNSGYTVIVLANYELVAEPIAHYLQQMLPRLDAR